jgi:hypothetical protein
MKEDRVIEVLEWAYDELARVSPVSTNDGPLESPCMVAIRKLLEPDTSSWGWVPVRWRRRQKDDGSVIQGKQSLEDDWEDWDTTPNNGDRDKMLEALGVPRDD